MEYKTNVMRILDKQKVQYRPYSYVDTDAISGVEVAAVLRQDPARVFKTLVTTAKSGQHYLFVIPVAQELDLKKAAAAVKEKAVEMIKAKDLLPLTGYVHGGCSPIGTKKPFPIVIHITAGEFESIVFSAGKIGYQVDMSLDELAKVIEFELADVIR